MSVEKIEQSVLLSATKEAEQIVNAAQRAADEHVAAGRDAATRAADKRYDAAVRVIDDSIARRLMQAKGAANKQLLERRNAVLKQLFDRAREAVLAWPPEQYSQVMGRLLTTAAGDRGGVLRIHPEDREAFNRALTTINSTRDTVAKLSIDEADPLPARGGFIFVTEGYEVDRSLDTILSELEHELAPELAAQLFKGTVA